MDPLVRLHVKIVALESCTRLESASGCPWCPVFTSARRPLLLHHPQTRTPNQHAFAQRPAKQPRRVPQRNSTPRAQSPITKHKNFPPFSCSGLPFPSFTNKLFDTTTALLCRYLDMRKLLGACVWEWKLWYVTPLLPALPFTHPHRHRRRQRVVALDAQLTPSYQPSATLTLLCCTPAY